MTIDQALQVAVDQRRFKFGASFKCLVCGERRESKSMQGAKILRTQHRTKTGHDLGVCLESLDAKAALNVQG